MRAMWTSLNIVISVITFTVFIPKCDFAVTRTSIGHIDNEPFARECDLAQKNESYCVPVYNCLTMVLFLGMNDSAIRARRCNSSTKEIYVCCEKHYIELEASLSTTTSTQKMTITHKTTTRQKTTTTQKTTTSSTLSMDDLNFKVGNENVDQVIVFTPTEKVETLMPVPQKFPQQAPVDDFDEGCGIQNIDSRIVGGDPSSKREFPWLSRLLRKDSQGDMVFSCSGALISSKVVLTAAHCLASDSLVSVGELHAVSLGEHETTCDVDANECLLNKRTVVVSSFVVHPQYNKISRNHDNDIGLVFLRDKVRFTDYILPICLLENTMEATEYSVAGWGRTETGTISGVKRKINVPPFSWSQCAKRYNRTKIQLTSRQICAGGIEGMDACQGDSGGPLMVRQNGMRWYAAGIVSLGLGCGRKGWPGIYVYVPHYVNWIKETIRQRVS